MNTTTRQNFNSSKIQSPEYGGPMVGQVIGFQRPRWTPTYTEKRPGDTRGESTFDNKNTMGRRREELGLGGPGVAAGKDHRLGRTFVGRVDKKIAIRGRQVHVKSCTFRRRGVHRRALEGNCDRDWIGGARRGDI